MDLAVALPLMALLLGLKGFFSGSEIALVNADRLKLRHRARQGDRGARLVLQALERPEKLLATTLVGTNLATIALTTIGTLTMLELFGGRIGNILAFVIFTPLFLILGEIVPKSVYQQSADDIVGIIIRPLRLFGVLFAPIVVAFASIARQAARLVGGGSGEAAMVSREQLEQVVRLAEQSTNVAAFDRGRIRRVISFARVAAGEAMVPIADVVAVPAETTLSEATRLALTHRIYRLPVFERSTSNIVGVFRLDAWTTLAGHGLDSAVREVMEPAKFVPTSQPLSTLLPLLLGREDQLVVAVDEYGSAVGIVTLNDVVYDVLGRGDWTATATSRRPGRRLVANDDGSFSLDPHLPMVELNDLLGAELPAGEATTLAGLMLGRFQRLPAAGDALEIGGWRIEVEAVDERTIASVRIAQA